MLDFSRETLHKKQLVKRSQKSAGFSDALIEDFDSSLKKIRDEQKPRNYLGGSRLGHPLAEAPSDRGCARQLFYEYNHYPKDPGKDFPGKLYRIFDQGHDCEQRMIEYFKYADFTLLTEKPDSKEQFGFAVMPDPVDGHCRIKGHADGVFVSGPDKLASPDGDIIMIAYPFLWECKSMNNKKFNLFRDKGVEKSHPIYYGQLQVYMGSLRLEAYPALFSAYNKDTGELAFQLVPYNHKHAQASVNRGIEVITAKSPTELMRAASDYEYLPCKWCEYREQCKKDESSTHVAAQPQPTWRQ